MKELFEKTDWPQMSADLPARIMAGIHPNGFAPWALLNTPRARVSLVLTMALCLVAGFVHENTYRARHAEQAVTSPALAYYLRT